MGLFFATAVAGVGCSGAESSPQVADIDAVDADESADSLAETSTYFIFSSADYRKCMWPMCGGDYVKRVNRASTKCADGTSSANCYVSGIDLSAIGFSDADASKITDGFHSSLVILRGKIEKRKVNAWTVGYLVATEAWVGQAASKATGLFYNVTDNGIRCIAAPCKSVHEARLNSSLDQEIASVDFGASGANSKQVSAANSALATSDGVIVAGSNYTVTGAAGKANALKASEFYLRALPAKKAPVCLDANTKGVRYVATTPMKCAVIMYSCNKGESAFSGECGCGCVASGVTQCGDKTCAAGETCNELESFPVQYKCSAGK